MKIKEFLNSLKDWKSFFSKPEAKADGEKHPESRFYQVRFGEAAYLASVRRQIRTHLIERRRRNTQGLPFGMDRQRMCAPVARIQENESKLIASAVNSTDEALIALGLTAGSTRSRLRLRKKERVEENTAARSVMNRPGKLARRVLTMKRSCSANRSMVNIMLRREAGVANA